MQARPELQVFDMFTRPVPEIVYISESWRDENERTAEQVEATFVRGYYHANGRYLEKDVNFGWILIRKAAKAGHPVAIAYVLDLNSRANSEKSSLKDSAHPIGIYYFGIRCFLDRNMKLAFESYKKSAILGFPDAAFNLSICYCSQVGMSQKDFISAAFWSLFATRKGHPKAKEVLSSSIHCAIEQEDPLSNFRIDSIPDFETNPNHPIRAYLSSPKDGRDIIIDAFCQKMRVAAAICIIDEVWVEIIPSKKDLYHQRAFELLDSCREVPEAQIHLAICFARGIGTPKNMKTAADILRNALKAGNPFARSYLESFGFPEDWKSPLEGLPEVLPKAESNLGEETNSRRIKVLRVVKLDSSGNRRNSRLFETFVSESPKVDIPHSSQALVRELALNLDPELERDPTPGSLFGFVGCPANSVRRVLSSGLDPRMNHSPFSGMFGHGITISENFDHADEFADESPDGNRYVVLVKVALGEPYFDASSRQNLEENSVQFFFGSYQKFGTNTVAPFNPKTGENYDSVVHIAGPGRYQTRHSEFVVYARHQIQPLFMIEYNHVPF